MSDPKSVHRGDLPERPRPLDISTIGKARGLLDNASSATAHGDHKDAIGYVRQAVDLLAAEVSGQLPIRRGTNGFGSSSSDPLVAAKERLAQLVAAKERLGVWLAAEPGRTWDRERELSAPGLLVSLHRDDRFIARGTGHDLASAIMSALEAAQEVGGRG